MVRKRGVDNHSIDVTRVEYREGPMYSMQNKSIICRCGICAVCVCGECSISTGASSYHLMTGTGMLFVTGTLMHLSECSEDLCIKMILFPKDRFTSVTATLDLALFNYIHEHPCYDFGGTDTGKEAFNGISLWMDMARMLFGKDFGDEMYKEQEEVNFLRGLFLWMHRTLDLGDRQQDEGKGRTLSVCHKFLALVHEYAAREHNVKFYADRLCISPRYLNQITVRHVDGLSPKKIIDDQVSAEIKVRLGGSSLSVTQIADELNFSDQTYMSSFFRRLTGQTPSQYRKSLMQRRP